VTVKKSHDAVAVMIVDDSEDDVEAARRAFRQAGADAPLQHLFSGEEALEALRPGGSPLPDLILLDLNMPGIGGRKTLEAIKLDGRLKHIPVVVLTTSSYEEDVRACYILGANSFVTKPVNFESFAQAIRLVKEYWFDTALLPRACNNDGTS
jgi:two-component system, response regulator